MGTRVVRSDTSAPRRVARTAGALAASAGVGARLAAAARQLLRAGR